jgi:hypothetical protein
VKSSRVVLFGLAVLVATGSARADNLDVALVKEAPNILQYLQSKGYKNVGTLNFRVKKGDKPITFQAGPLNANLPYRLENALIHANQGDKSVGVIHEASRVAAEKRFPPFTAPRGRNKLFSEEYSLAWGNDKVQADAFLTGVVIVTPDMKSTQVKIEAFDRSMKDGGNFEEVAKFELQTDRSMLADIGQSFVVPRGVLKRGGDDADLFAEESAAKSDMGVKETPVEPSPNSNAPPVSIPVELAKQMGEKPVELEIRYDGKKQEVIPDPDNGGEKKVPEPNEGQRVTFWLKNISNSQVGVVLKINGKSTFQEDESEAARCLKWILDPNEGIELAGFYKSMNEFVPFKVLSQAESQAASYTSDTGMIQVYAFIPVEDNGPKKVSLPRGVSPRQTASAPRTRSLTLDDEKRSLNESMKPPTKGNQVRARGLITSTNSGQSKEDKVEKVDFPTNPQLQYSEAIRYYKP